MLSNIFLKKILQKLIAHIFTLLLAPFASKLVNYSRPIESLNIRNILKSATFSFEKDDFSIFKHSSKTHSVPLIIEEFLNIETFNVFKLC